jgi:uncharacterized membrane protein
VLVVVISGLLILFERFALSGRTIEFMHSIIGMALVLSIAFLLFAGITRLFARTSTSTKGDTWRVLRALLYHLLLWVCWILVAVTAPVLGDPRQESMTPVPSIGEIMH